VKEVDSDALGIVNKALGLTGRPSTGGTEFLDSVMFQGVDVTKMVRRGRTLANTQGLFYALIRNIHAVDSVVSTQVNPYNLAADGLRPPFPSPIPPEFDFWLLGAAINRISGSGTIAATLNLQYNLPVLGFGVDSAAAAETNTANIRLAFWDAFQTVSGTFGLLSGSAQPFKKIGLRLRREATAILAFESDSSALMTVECQMLWGLFPVSLGQDGAVA